MEVIAFWILAVIVGAAAVFVIAARNPVHSVLWLILSFFTSAALLVLIGAEFLAMLLVVVYVGAVAVLFLFVVMMLDVDFVELKQGFLSYLPFAALIGLAFFAEIAMVSFAGGGEGTRIQPSPGADSNAEAIGLVMYTDYLLLFQAAGIILLVAMIGAIVLTLRHRPHVKRQNIAQQTSRRRADATELVDVAPGKGI
ncbi:MAG: NADH-quinone oxidoreductase subunit J [Hyphomonadaceae bacterium]|nr:NADH-quinone oxidoreductase subunit J [Hyphomonadaceae bacterium]